MWHTILKTKITHLSAVLLFLNFNQSWSSQLPNYPVTQSPKCLITQLPNHQVTQSPNPPGCLTSNQSSSRQDDISAFLPKKGETGTWQPTGSIDKAVGEDLFLLINGGAEIYHEYGFKQTIMQSYENNNGKAINLEIFEMEDAASAYGIYSFKTGSRGKVIPSGNEALIEDYYLNFWKGNFLVTITGFDSEKETIDGLITIAEAIDAKIKNTGKKPQLVHLLPDENLCELSVKYLKGNLALFNNYEFGSGNIFGLKIGVMGNYGKYKIFIFKYDDKYESEKWFENAKKSMKSNARFDVYDMPVCSDFSVFDKNGDRIFMKLYQDFIIIVVGTVTTEGNEIIGKVQSRIKRAIN